MNEDHLKGAFGEAKGTIKEAVGGAAGDAKTEYEGKGEKLAGQARQAWGDARDTMSDLAGNATEAAARVADQAESTLHGATKTAKKHAGKVANTVSDAANSAGETLSSTVQDRPIVMLAAAGLVGFAIGYLLRSPLYVEPEPRGWRQRRR